MAKILFIVALCVASTLALPKGHGSTDGLGDLPACFEALQNSVAASFEGTIGTVKECAKDAVEEIIALEEEVTAAAQKVVADVQAQIAALKACGNDVACKVAVIKEVAGVIAQYVNDVNEIVTRHLANLEAQAPEAAECARAAFVTLHEEVKAAAQDFIACVKA